ncbi:aminopeptidase P family protein [Arenibaculum sp.]|jgi:Xaa-Pro aminopeptidase|uniref:aminopeptidase P family protein n=1 Tax=Arenibaculum sp. TaxID=2865862 RepID=UPI002E14B786|nr:aminopeptidase P family protein [Arenibaculum sp.]
MGMATGRTAYRGDDALAGLLSSAGIRITVEDLRGLVAGVNAAPPGQDPDGWMILLGADPATLPDTLRAQLRALKDDMAAGDGVGGGGPDPVGRIAALRAELDRRGLAGFVVPRADEHQGEYLPARAERLAWLTGFTGSAGVAVVLRDAGAIFVDGRYTLQVRQQLPAGLLEYRHLVDEPHVDWIAANLPAGGRLGYDPWLHTVGWVERARQAAAKAGGELVPVTDNPVDAIWGDQPSAPIAPVVPHDVRFAGRGAEDKMRDVAAAIARDGVAAAVLNQPDSIAWLLNIRGTDVPHTPLPLSFAVLHADAHVDLFVDRRKLVPGLESHLGNRVSLRDPAGLGDALDGLGREGRKVLVDPASATAWTVERLSAAGAQVVRGTDPCVLPKARKNEVELEGTRAAHRRDAVAMARFLAWLAREAPSGRIGEIGAAERLHAFRSAGERFRGDSFVTISGAGPNGAVVHYHVTPATERRIEPGTLYLIDSGGQYDDGTTDVTRTVAVGQPTPDMRDRFTRVLKGHIALATVRFPRGTTGSQLDVLARQYLWQAGLDFDHGTGHGVGSYLGVHEGPQRISKVPNAVALEPGMILSNEPGYYETGAYGIRIENLIAVEPCAELPGAGRPMLSFETLTLVPIDLALVEPGLMTAGEIAWLNAYHARVREAVLPDLDREAADWLTAATAPIVA